jgi:allantoin racemase
MRILIINPNTSVEMSRTIDSTAKKYASPGTEITTVNPQDGPDFIANAYHAALQAPKVVELVEKNRENYDAFIIACGSDPGLEACRIVTQNVLGVGESAIMTACAVAKRFSFLTPLKGGVLSRRERLHSLGIDQSRCASVRVVGSGISDEIVRKRHQMLDVYCQVGQKCVDEDGASALILTCAGMSDLKGYLEERLKVPIFSGVETAVKIAEQLPTW